MPKLSKDRLMKLHGITEPTGPTDPAVLARRKYHEAAIKWSIRNTTPLISAFALISIVFVLLPVLVESWRVTIEGIPVIRNVFESYSTPSLIMAAHVWILASLYFVATSQTKNHPAGLRTNLLTLQNILDMELLPRNKKEEKALWSDLTFQLFSVTIPLPFFGGFAVMLDALRAM